MKHDDLKILNKNISFRDRSKDLILLEMSNKHPVGSLIVFYPLKNNIIDKAIVCGHIIKNGVAKYLINKSVKNVFSITEKQLLES